MRYHDLLEWLKPQTQTILNANKVVELQELSFIAARNANGTASLEDSLAVSYKGEHNLPV